MAKQEFEAYIQQPTQDVMAYMANKQRLFNQGWPHSQDLPYLRKRMIDGLCNPTVKRELLMKQFSTVQQLRDTILAVVSSQKEIIREGIALDSTMDGLYSSNDPINLRPEPPAAVAAAQPMLAPMPRPQMALKPQPQYQMQPQPPYQIQAQPFYPPQPQFPSYAIQAMPAACFGCGQPGHMERECPEKRQHGYQQQGGGQRSHGGNQRFHSRNSLICYRCLSQGHVARDCRMPEPQADAIRKQKPHPPSYF